MRHTPSLGVLPAPQCAIILSHSPSGGGAHASEMLSQHGGDSQTAVRRR